MNKELEKVENILYNVVLDLIKDNTSEKDMNTGGLLYRINDLVMDIRVLSGVSKSKYNKDFIKRKYE